MHNYINTDYFAPIVSKYYSQTFSNYKDSGYPHEPFVPYAMPNYLEAPIKIFYVGIDTLNWGHAEDYLERMKENQVKGWLQEHADRCGILNMLEENKATFFSLIARIHLLVRIGKYYESLSKLSTEEQAILNEIGYGNTYSIELPNTLEKEECNIDVEKTGIVYDCSYHLLDGFIHIIKAYNPDYIVVANGSLTRDMLRSFKYLKYNQIYYLECPLLKVWELEEFNTKIINVNHPNNRLGIDMETIARNVVSFIK